MSGGFLGVEVFFVVSGFLITMLLIEERESSGEVNFRSFWVRRGRRLFPALGVVLVAVSTWVALFGSAEQASQMRRDLPWSVLYAANWGQIVGDVPYFAAGDPPMLRHLWSLAVEATEQCGGTYVPTVHDLQKLDTVLDQWPHDRHLLYCDEGLVGAIYITFVCLLPEFLILKYNVPFYFGGTSLLIIVVVTMDFMAQVQALPRGAGLSRPTE